MKRRQFILSASAAVGAAAGPFFHIRPAKADSGELVVVSWGGDYDDALRQFVCEPYQKQTGVRVRVDTPPENAKVKAMVESGNVIWDVLLTDVPAVSLLSSSNLLEPMDYDALDKKLVAAIPKELQLKNAIGQRIFSWNIVYNTNALPKAKHPESWADVWDGKKFAGGRSFNFSGGTSPQLEIALLADGVPMDKLYPLDVERAFKKLDTIKKNTIWWTTNSQSQQLFTDGEVTCGLILNGRVYDAVQKGAKITLVWNQNIQSVDYLVIPKGSKNRDAAMALIGEMTVAENQAKLANMIAYSPTNPEAFKTVDPALSPWLSTNPENAAKGFVINAEYWRDKYEELAERWSAWKLA